MKSIWKKILIFVVLPFLVIYAGLSVFIIQQVYRTQIRKAAQQLYHLALYNEVHLKNFYEILELSARISSAELEKINPDDPNARETGEHIITTQFHNSQVINAWFIFEPNAFDGRDLFHTNDYPGAPSGRYIRSFTRNGSWFWYIAGDINEAELNDREKSYWYLIPRDTGELFSDLGTNDRLWDYGKGLVSAVGVVSPIFRNNKVIGCVGLDALMNEEILGEGIYPEAVSAIFLSDGRLGYSLNTENVDKTLEDLGFDEAIRVRDAMKEQRSLYLYNEYSGITNVKSYSYFHPVRIEDKVIYIYTSLPQRTVWLNTIPAIQPVVISLLLSLAIFSLLLLYLSFGIAAPLKKLTLASESLAAGNMDVQIGLTHSSDELGMITVSLGRMAEQFRISKIIQKRYQDRFDIVLAIHYALFRCKTLDEAFSAALTAVTEYFRLYKASLVFILNNSARIAAMYPAASHDEGDSEFFCHNRVKELLKGKKHLTMNYGTLSSMKLSFVDFNTKALCILPLRRDEVLRGYIIMEGKEPEAFIHDDTTLLFLADTLSYIISFRVDWEQNTITPDPAPIIKAPGAVMIKQETSKPEDADTFLEKAKTIQGLDIDKGILLIGGEKEKYTELLRVTIRVITDGILKMRGLYIEDIPAFAIEIHGMKSALYSIGAETLGDEARQLEFAAKSDDAGYCRENYPVLEEKLRTLCRNLAALFPQQERSSRKGSASELSAALLKAQEASANFDASAANALLTPFSFVKWDDEEIVNLLEGIGKDLENIEYDAAGLKIGKLLGKLGNKV
ncbi:hypothetical protein AGMMS50230_00920 [Spirochaetia bacterium]|nr:hypothetical protein AGMMS50230_00920 [Spirochaetia bacterium]